MLAWERREGETDKAWYGFQLYRDMGPERTLRAVAEALYGDRAKYGLRTVEKWSSRFEWRDRVRALEARDDMIRREAVEDHLRTRAAEFAETQLRIAEKLLENSEKAAGQAEKMLEWPLTEQRVVREEGGVDGEDVTYVFMPAGWSKATARTMHDMAASAVGGFWSTHALQPQELDMEYDFSDLSNDELKTYLSLAERLGVRRIEE